MSLKYRIKQLSDKIGYGIIEPLMVKKINDNLYRNTKEDISYTRKELDNIDSDRTIIIMDIMADDET